MRIHQTGLIGNIVSQTGERKRDLVALFSFLFSKERLIKTQTCHYLIKHRTVTTSREMEEYLHAFLNPSGLAVTVRTTFKIPKFYSPPTDCLYLYLYLYLRRLSTANTSSVFITVLVISLNLK
jgi:hypothetical protein